MQQLLNGVFIGSIYALFAIGFTLVFGILDRLNLAHPSVFAVSAFVGIELVADGGLSIWLALPIVLLVGAVLGLIIERLAFRPLKNRPDAHFAGLISSIALAGMFIALLQWRYGPDTRRFPAGSFPETPVQFAGVSVTVLQVAILFISVVLMVGLSWRTGLVLLSGRLDPAGKTGGCRGRSAADGAMNIPASAIDEISPRSGRRIVLAADRDRAPSGGEHRSTTRTVGSASQMDGPVRDELDADERRDREHRRVGQVQSVEDAEDRGKPMANST